MAGKNKYYVVWKGKKPGIYENWNDCKKQIQGFEGARYMGFPEKEEARAAFDKSYEETLKARKVKSEADRETLARIGPPSYNSIAVDAASSGNPGVMEYQGVDTRSGKTLFAQGPFHEGTNNIGEFLAIVHGLAYLKKRNSNRVIYSDSRTAISWVKKKKCNTRLKESDKNGELFHLIRRAEHWLQNNSYTTPVVKWETRAWGEIPADFGRK
ncbi:MAG: ribonuclease H [Bacteroidetes bacterium]|jgi:ribonuclease HI|nr:MAG: ribonuclease H [Bacteroidota bacterium]UCE68309.1 MAG: ribonuclease H family protein [Flavobacteriaceae bacterium]